MTIQAGAYLDGAYEVRWCDASGRELRRDPVPPYDPANMVINLNLDGLPAGYLFARIEGARQPALIPVVKY